MAERRVCSSAPQADSKTTLAPPPTMRDLDSKNSQLRRKLSLVEEENNSLVLENRQLISELEALNLELASSKTKVRVLGSTMGSKNSSVSLMKEEIECLEVEVEAQGNALRDAEKRLEETQETLVMKSRLVDKLKEELMVVRAEIDDRASQEIRVEQQRNEALITAERQTEALQGYKENMSEKLRKVFDNEARLKEALIQCDKEREAWERKCCQFEHERADMSQLIGQLKEDSVRAEAVSVENATLRSRLEEASIRSVELEQKLSEKEAVVLRDLDELRKENGDLRHHTSSQEQQLGQCQREIEHNQAELASLEAILSLLHLRESGRELLCAESSPTSGPSGNVPNLRPREQYQQLLPVLRAVEEERSRQAGLALGLQQRLSQAQEEMSALQSSMIERDHQLKKLHSELQERIAHISQLEVELRRNNTRLTASEKQLEEKASSFSQAVEKNAELEQNLLEKSSSIRHFKTTLDTKQRDLQQALEESQRVRSEQCKDQDQIKKLHFSLDQKQSQLVKLEKDFSSAQHERQEAQHERQEAQHRADKLQTSLSQFTQETEKKTKQDQEALRTLKAQATESTTQMNFLETALSTCQDELSSCMQQIKRAKGHYERELDTRAKEMEALQADVRSSSLVCQSSSEQNLQLQYTVQRQQAMLQESTSRVTHLEDSQALLLEQVARLEKELEKEMASKEVKRREQRAQEASQQAENCEREALQLSVMQLTEEMSKCRGQLTEREQESLRIRRDSDTKVSQLAKMEKMLQDTKGLMEKKTMSGTESEGYRDNMVEDLEERVRCSKRDRRNSLHHTQMLESQMKTVRGELVDTLDHLQELRNKLRRSQEKAEERKATMDKLAAGLRETQIELEHIRRELNQKNQEVADKDTALKESQEALQQKALQLSMLEVAVENHTQEMEQKLILQQGAFETSQREAKERTKQVEFLNERLELIRTQLQGKENLEEEAIVQGQNLRLGREKLQWTMQNLQEMRSRCEGLAMQVEESAEFGREKESQARHVEEELGRMEKQAAQTEARLRATVASLRQELDTLRRLHQNELSSLQQRQAEVLKASEYVSSTLRSSQDHLTLELQNTRAQQEEAQRNNATLLAELQSREQLLQSTSETLLIKESEVTRLKTKISSIERTSELHNIAVRSGLTTSDHNTTGPSSFSPQRRREDRSSTVAADWPDDDSLDLPQSLKESVLASLKPQSLAEGLQCPHQRNTTFTNPLIEDQQISRVSKKNRLDSATNQKRQEGTTPGLKVSCSHQVNPHLP